MQEFATTTLAVAVYVFMRAVVTTVEDRVTARHIDYVVG